MTSLNEQVNQLHEAFCDVTDRQLHMNPTFERWWYQALKYDVTPQMVHDVMESRLKRDYSTSSMRLYCLSLKHLIGDDDRLAQFVDEAAALEANKRKKVYSPGKASVLESTGRPGEPEPPKVRHVSEVDWKSQVELMRKEAAQ